MGNGKYWDKAWSLVDGCTQVSPGCDHCWLRSIDRIYHKENLTKVTPRWDRLNRPLKTRKPAIFSVWSDLFHQSVPHDFQVKALMTMEEASRHTFLVLTKRPEIMSKVVRLYGESWGTLKHVWLGVTLENQDQEQRVEDLLQTIAAHRFVSIEPMLGPLNIEKWLGRSFCRACGCSKAGIHRACTYCGATVPDNMINRGLDWVICGGETGHGARPMEIDWAWSVYEQCRNAGVPFWFKDFGKVTKLPAMWEDQAGFDRSVLLPQIREVPWR